MRAARTSTAVLCSLLAAASLTACTSGPPGPGDTLAALAAGLTSGDLADVPFVVEEPPSATEQVRAATEPLGDLPRTVTVVATEVDDEAGTASATLEHSWDLDQVEVDWTFTTAVALELVEDEWRVRWSPEVLAPGLTAGETLHTSRLGAERAPVLGAGGTPLVGPRPVLRLGIDKAWVEPEQTAQSALAVAGLLGLDPQPYADRVAAAGEKAFVEALVVRQQEPGVDLLAFEKVAGARAVADELPLAPTRRFARPILGTAGPATAEIVEASDGAVVAGDVAGLSGLQRQYDAQLRGTPGAVVTAVAGEAERVLHTVDPVPGQPLRTTLDPVLQERAESILEAVVPDSAIVAVRPSTGEVLAAASGPGAQGYSTATLATHAPGSVFKVVGALAMLRAGLDPDTPVRCPTSITVDGRAFVNFPDYPAAANGTVPLRTAFAHSCNTAFIGAREVVPPEALASAAASLGVGVDADLGYPAFLGSVPVDSTGTDHAASMIGQARIQTSPLAMATAAASVAAGRTVVPWLVGDGPPEAPAPATPLTEAEAQALRDLMRAVVTEGGAGLLADVPGEPVLAKTGTAEVGDGEDRHNHTWMIAVQGDLAVAVFVERGEYGSTTAGPLLEQMLTG